MSYFDIYLWTLLFKIQALALIFTLLLSSFALVILAIGICEEEGIELRGNKNFKALCVATGISLLLCVALPSKDDATLIIAAGAVAKVVENKDVQRVAGKSLQVVEKWLDESAKGAK